ncbi:MAG: ABC transporter ATP-binding protein [Alphaproteobacteria bacterium]|nr:ABC transporter ATP-binding protein [Alphaproteobacteria bacterium]
MSGIVVDALSKRFYTPEPVQAVDALSFTCSPGEVFGLLGPNGAGKTTTLRMLSTLLTPDSGAARVAGHDLRAAPRAVRASIGYVSTTTGLYGRLTARELLATFARLQGVADPRGRAEDLIARFDITPFADLRCDRLSTGMKQKVSIARAMVADPPVLILDEPTTGLDVLVAQSFLAEIRRARDEGRCVLFSTHIMSQAERVCDRVGVMHKGRMLACGTLEELRAQTGRHYLEDIFLALVGERP